MHHNKKTRKDLYEVSKYSSSIISAVLYSKENRRNIQYKGFSDLDMVIRIRLFNPMLHRKIGSVYFIKNRVRIQNNMDIVIFFSRLSFKDIKIKDEDLINV